MQPTFWIGHIQAGQVLGQLGRVDEALRAFEEAARYSADNSKTHSFRGYTLAAAGRTEETRAVLASLEQRARERYVPPYAIALIYAGLNDSRTALAWLEKAHTARDVHLVFLPVDARWDGLRNDPAFSSLVEQCAFYN